MENREKKKVVIVIPVHRLPLLPEEKISLQHLRHFLSGYDRCLVVPRSLNVPGEVLEDLKLMRFDDSYFANIDGYNRLMLSQAFYRKFRAYEYILLYQLDCLVFSEDLRHWCKQGWDYVGAPWFKGHRGETSDGLWAVGNGGLSLRKVSAFLNVLRTRRIWRSAIEVANETPRFLRYPKIRKLFILSKAIFHAFGYKNTIGYFIRTFPQYEDLFWAFHASQIQPDFTIPTPDEALPFSFECAPRYCFEKNSRQLPFGCHGWYTIDPEFWRPFLLASPRSADSQARTELTPVN